jgi:ectoine hydroxylase-related dioxygenase (phytanoyl-CoA dioxygenase family)
MSPTLLETFAIEGYAIAPQVLSPVEVAAAIDALQAIPLTSAGTRNLLNHDWCQSIAQHLRRQLQPEILPPTFVAIQCTLFDKTAAKNWLVAFHQDLSVPVQAPVIHPELSGWSQKEGQHFVQPPIELLEQLVAIRVHLDDCGLHNGPLRVIPGSHNRGRLSEKAVSKLRETTRETICLVAAGSALLLRPLILHASSKALSPDRRRVLHFVFTPPLAGYGLQWAQAI